MWGRRLTSEHLSLEPSSATTGPPSALAPCRPEAHAVAPYRLRFRAIVLALILAPLNVFAIVWGNWMSSGGALAQSMAAPAVAGICVLSVLNAGLRHRHPQWALHRGELIAIYSALAVSTGLCATPWDWCPPQKLCPGTPGRFALSLRSCYPSPRERDLEFPVHCRV